MIKTHVTKAKDIHRNWHLIDAKDQALGRLASQIAQLLIGKSKTDYVAYLDCGDWVVVINAAKIELTGRKPVQKIYHSHSGYPGGYRQVTFAQQMANDPRQVIRHAVNGMLPKNKLRDPRLARLKVFADEKHDFEDKLKPKTQN
jgi:large subunit ribosomal protein L13